MSYDPTQQTPQPVYPPQPGYSPPAEAYPPQIYAPQNYPQSQPSPYTAYGGPPPPQPGFDFNAFWKKLGLTGQIAGIAGVAMIIFFIVPWVSSGIDSANGFSVASASDSTVNLFAYVWLIFLGVLGLILLAVLISQGRLSAKNGAIAIIETSAVMTALELCFLLAINSLSRGTTGGTAAGFWLTFVATLGALGGAIFGYTQLRKGVAPGAPIQPPYGQPQYPGAYPGSQPQYPGQPPQYPPSQ